MIQKVQSKMADIVERFNKVMNNPLNIRNICTSAHIHHGKCISKDSRSMLEEGRILTAEEFYDYSKKWHLFEIKRMNMLYMMFLNLD